MALASGSRVFLCYDLPPPELWHERYILAQCGCGQGWHIVMTPDRDIYPEQISLENQDLSGFRIRSEERLPYGLTEANTHRLRALPSDEEMRQILVDARHAAAAMGGLPGAPAGVVAPQVGGARAQPGEGQADDGSKWVAVETEGGRVRGQEVTLDGAEVIRGDIGLKQEDGCWFAIRKVKGCDIGSYPGKEASADARLLGVTFQGLSRNERQWRDVAKEMQPEEFS